MALLPRPRLSQYLRSEREAEGTSATVPFMIGDWDTEPWRADGVARKGASMRRTIALCRQLTVRRSRFRSQRVTVPVSFRMPLCSMDAPLNL